MSVPRLFHLLLLTGCLGSTGADVPSTVAARGAFDVTLSVAGELEARNSVTISTPRLGVASIKVTELIDEGTRVEKGDVLVDFEKVELERELASATSDLEVAQTKIAQARSRAAVSMADARGEVTRAELGLQRAQMRLTESETVPRIEREGAKLDVIEQEMSIARAKSAMTSTQLQIDAELQLLELEAEKITRRVDVAREQLAEAVVTAPSSGIVIFKKFWKSGSMGTVAVGDTLWGGRAIIELPDLSSMQVVAWVHEVDSARVAEGQTVDVVIDAHPDPSHSGKVTRVADLAVRRGKSESVKHLKVTIDLDETVPIMKPGMTVRAELLLEHLDDVISVPIEAIGRRDEDTWVWTSNFRGWRKQPVELGIENDTHVVILSGLEEGAEVALVDPERFSRGEARDAAEDAP